MYGKKLKSACNLLGWDVTFIGTILDTYVADTGKNIQICPEIVWGYTWTIMLVSGKIFKVYQEFSQQYTLKTSRL